MTKKACTYTLVFAIAIIFILWISIIPGTRAEAIKPEEAINEALIESQAKLEEININSYVIFEGKYMTIDNMKKICNDIAERLNIKDVELDEIADNSLSQIVITGLIKDKIYTKLIVQSTNYDKFKETTIVLDIIDTKGEYDLGELCDTIKKVLSSYGEARLNITLKGSYDDRLKNGDAERILKKIFRRIEAKKTEGIDTSDLVSVTGYTPRINEYLSYGNKKANINIAFRYNSHESKTNIWIGTPVIVTAY